MGPGTSPGAGAGGAREPTGDPGRGAGPDTSPDEPAGGAPRGALRELLWLVPRLAGLIAGLARDSRVPGRTKLALGAAALYLASPVDLVPDFVPFLGYLDDVLLVAVVLDGLLTHVDRAILAEHWPGDPASLDRAARLSGRLAGWVPRRLKARVFGPGAP